MRLIILYAPTLKGPKIPWIYKEFDGGFVDENRVLMLFYYPFVLHAD